MFADLGVEAGLLVGVGWGVLRGVVGVGVAVGLVGGAEGTLVNVAAMDGPTVAGTNENTGEYALNLSVDQELNTDPV